MIRHDVLIVGGGGAGLRAAIAAAETAPELSVAVVSKVHPIRSHTVAAEGGAAGVVKESDSFEKHIRDTVTAGAGLSDQDAVETFVREAPRELGQLEDWGCPWSREPNGEVAVRALGGMGVERSWFAGDRTGFHLLHTLFHTSLGCSGVTRHDEWLVTKLLVDDGECQGVVAIELMTGKVHAIAARAVILCTGGAGKMFLCTTNSNIKTGDGMALAHRAGVPLKDMEFVQWHPTALPGSGILITEACRGEGGWLVNRDGHRYLQDHGLGEPHPHPVRRSMELSPRDQLVQAFVEEVQRDGTFNGIHGPHVHLDLRHLGRETIQERLPIVREICLRHAGIDPVDEPIPVRPAVHYFMGGVHTDVDGATPVRGLYAAGECACVSIHGANRLGSNSLTELLVFGARAGKSAAEFAQTRAAPSETTLAARVEEESSHLTSMLGGGREHLSTLRSELQRAMEEGAGIRRDEGSLRAAAAKIAELRERNRDVHLDDSGRIFNTEWVAAIELGHLLDAAEACVHSALSRRESRGAHCRSDHPGRDDEHFLAHTLAHRREGAEPRIEHLPVTVTRWPLGEPACEGPDEGAQALEGEVP